MHSRKVFSRGRGVMVALPWVMAGLLSCAGKPSAIRSWLRCPTASAGSGPSSPACPACKPAVQQLTTLLAQGDAQLRVVTVSVEGAPPPFAERPEISTTDLSPSLAAWFDETRGGVATPHFMGLACDDAASLRLVGFVRCPMPRSGMLARYRASDRNERCSRQEIVRT